MSNGNMPPAGFPDDAVICDRCGNWTDGPCDCPDDPEDEGGDGQDMLAYSRLEDVYRQRNRLVQLVGSMAMELRSLGKLDWRAWFPAHTDPPIREPRTPWERKVNEEHSRWPVLYIETPAGQISFHLPEMEIWLPTEEEVPPGANWDGHDNDTKWERVQELVKRNVLEIDYS